MPAPSIRLVPALGRGDLTALVVNTVIGSGIFGLPLLVTGLVGAGSLLAYVAAAAGIGLIALCFAEVGAQFRAAGGPYLYAREAFGPFVGMQVGWITWLMRISAAAATARIFTDYAAVVWPAAARPIPQDGLITGLFALLAWANIRGVRAGARASNALVMAKLVPLAALVVFGAGHIRAATFFGWRAAAPPGVGGWLQAVLLLIFAFGGFDNAMFPASEMRDPRRDVPFGLLAGLAVVAVFYLSIQAVFQGVVVPGTASAQPLAAAAERIFGRAGGPFIAAGAMLSIWGWFAATILGTPRLTYAMAEQGDLPAALAAVHARYRTPYSSILLYVAASWILALAGSFEWNASLSAVARLATYGATCAALPVFRRRGQGVGSFRIPCGALVSALGIGFCVVLVTQMGSTEFVLLAATMLLAAASWVVRTRTAPRPRR